MHETEGYGTLDVVGGRKDLRRNRVTILRGNPAPARRTSRAGIMGGICVDEALRQELPARRSLLDNQPQKTCSLTMPRVVTAIYTAALVVILLVMHMHMEFAVRDWKIQQRTLQLRRHELDRQAERILRINTQYTSLERLHNYATEHLRMQPILEAETLVISETAKRKYTPRTAEHSSKNREVRFAGDKDDPHRHLSLLSRFGWLDNN